MPDPQGLVDRYIISRRDGIPVSPEEEFFVLRLDNNQTNRAWLLAARTAIVDFADRIEDSNPLLAQDLLNTWPVTQELFEEIYGPQGNIQW